MIRSFVGQVEVRSVRGSGRLGLFDESTVDSCKNAEKNKLACNYLCLASGTAGWNGTTLEFCKSICIEEACGNGILLTPHGMQTVVAKLGDCLSFCYGQAEKLTDPIARQAARIACPSTCGLANELAKLPASDKRPAKTTPIPPPPKTTPPAPTPPPTEKKADMSWLLWAGGAAAVLALILASNTAGAMSGMRMAAGVTR